MTRRLCAQLLEMDGSHLLRCMAEALESSPYCAAHASLPHIRVTRIPWPTPPVVPEMDLPWHDDEDGERD